MCGFEGTYLFGPVAQLVRAPPCHGGGRRFDPVPGRFCKMRIIASNNEIANEAVFLLLIFIIGLN